MIQVVCGILSYFNFKANKKSRTGKSPFIGDRVLVCFVIMLDNAKFDMASLSAKQNCNRDHKTDLGEKYNDRNMEV